VSRANAGQRISRYIPRYIRIMDRVTFLGPDVAPSSGIFAAKGSQSIQKVLDSISVDASEQVVLVLS